MTDSKAVGSRYLVCFVVAAFAFGCGAGLRNHSNGTATTSRAFSDAMVNLIIEDNAKEIWRMMEPRFRGETSEAQMRPVLDQIYAQPGGRPLEAHFKSQAAGRKLYLDGTSNPMEKFWYAVRTTTHGEGEYFLFIEVVPEGTSFACTGFSIVSFVGGVPAVLR